MAHLHRTRSARIRAWLAALAVLAAVCPAGSALARPAPYAPAYGTLYAATLPVPGAPYRDGQTGRFTLDGAWLYRDDPGNTGVGDGLWRDVASTVGWSPVTVPDADNAGDFSAASMAGRVGWYRRDLRLPSPGTGRHWIVRFESVNYRATVYLNGRLVGRHTGGYVPFELDLRPRRGVNRLIVRVDGRRGSEDIPPGPADGASPYSGGWWNSGGILRDVILREADRADLSQVSVRPEIRCPTCPATIHEDVAVRSVSARPVSVSLRGRFGSVTLDFGTHRLLPGETWAATASVRLPRPHLWAPGDPHLYPATLTLSGPGGVRLGGYRTESGVRLIRVVAGQLQLNGRRLTLRGVGLHEQDLAEGAALDPGRLARLLSWVAQVHAGIIRSHYPLDPVLLEAADRAGVLVWSEVPVYQEPSQRLGDPTFRAAAATLLRESILADQNHPSILLWSIGNELPTPADANETDYIASAAAQARSLDPSRPVGMAVSDWPGVPCQAAYAPLDVIGINEYFGWYDAGIGATADRDELSAFLDSRRACYPTQALMVTEFGFEANRDGPVEERGTYAFQSDAIAYHLAVFATKPWLSGAILWALQDFPCRPAWGGGNPVPDPPFFHKGIFDLTGNPKPSFALVRDAFATTVQIAPSG